MGKSSSPRQVRTRPHVLVSAVLTYHIVTGYDDVDNLAYGQIVDGSWSDAYSEQGTFQLTSPEDVTVKWPQFFTYTNNKQASTTLLSTNQPMVLLVDNNNNGAFTGGDASNTVTIAVTYMTLDLSTGVYE